MTDARLRIFTGTSNPKLAHDIAAVLNMEVSDALVGTYKNGETRVRLHENVRGCDVFIVQSTCMPVDHSIMELCLMIDAARRASAKRVTAVIPYYGYARQERKTAGREPISAKLVANMIATAGAERIVAVDLHAAAIEGFFDIPVDHLRAAPLLVDHFKQYDLSNAVVVSPDAGGVLRANDFRERVGAPLAIIAKQRPRPDELEVMDMVGDVRGKTAIIVDDLISTGSTLTEAARMLMERGAERVWVAATHAAWVGSPAAEDARNFLKNPCIERIVITDTIQVPHDDRNGKIKVVSVASLLGEAMMRIYKGLSVSALFH
ncbi:MAG: ribose-phosphate pyrophosphokinase [Chloroflexota bacterium]|nr:ribose-phosphate pyrophosphokinase [Chloroflexota bacterium]